MNPSSTTAHPAQNTKNLRPFQGLHKKIHFGVDTRMCSSQFLVAIKGELRVANFLLKFQSKYGAQHPVVAKAEAEKRSPPVLAFSGTSLAKLNKILATPNLPSYCSDAQFYLACARRPTIFEN